MYRIGEKRKFELYGGIFYTGVITDVDEFEIHIDSIMDEELSFNRKEVKQSKVVNSIGERNEK